MRFIELATELLPDEQDDSRERRRIRVCITHGADAENDNDVAAPEDGERDGAA